MWPARGWHLVPGWAPGDGPDEGHLAVGATPAAEHRWRGRRGPAHGYRGLRRARQRVRQVGDARAAEQRGNKDFSPPPLFCCSYDPKLCAFAVIFASSFMYNLMGEISMENLRLLRDVAKFDDVFHHKFNMDFPLAPPFWVVQGARTSNAVHAPLPCSSNRYSGYVGDDAGA
jgi:hypothetical protein